MMTSSFLCRLVSAAAIGAATLIASAPTAHADPVLSNEDQIREADRLYREGVAAFQRNDLQGAYESFKAAFQLKQAYDIAGNLGDVERRMGRARDAAEHLAFSLRRFPTNGKPEAREKTEKGLAEVRAKVGAVTVRSSENGATISVDGKPVGASPITEELFLDPGEHRIGAAVEDRKTEQIVATAAGSRLTVDLVLPKRKGGGGGTQKPLWPAVLLGVVGASGIGVGIAGFVVSAGKASDESDFAGQVKAAGGCASAAQLCTDGEDAASGRRTFLTMGAVGTSLGAAALVGMTIYLLLPSEDPSGATSLRILPVVGATSGLLLEGTF